MEGPPLQKLKKKTKGIKKAQLSKEKKKLSKEVMKASLFLEPTMIQNKKKTQKK